MSKRPARTNLTVSSATTRPGARVMWRSLEERQSPERTIEMAASEPEVSVPDVQLTSLAKNGSAKALPVVSSSLVENLVGATDSGLGRRRFMTSAGVAGGAMALSGCLRRPVEHILPYTRQPELTLPGIPLHYATALPRRGDVLGVVVESHEGRPTKIEGNSLHQASNPGGGRGAMGGTDMQTQAEILNLYDIDRSSKVMRKQGDGRDEASWDAFEEWLEEQTRGGEGAAGDGMRFLMAPTTSPTLVAMKAAVKERFPEARFHYWSGISDWNALEGARLALGQPLNTVVNYARARVVLSLDCDFLLTETGNARWQRGFSDARRMESANDAQRGMNRLYVVESGLSVTGANADHRYRLPSVDVGRFLKAVAARLAGQGASLAAYQSLFADAGDGLPESAVAAVADDLARAPGASVVVVGSRQPVWVHALAQAVNHALRNIGTDRTITYWQPVDAEQTNPVEDLKALTADLSANRVRTLFIVGVNPAYDAPSDIGFTAALANAANKVHLGAYDDETAALCDWHLPMAHELESWGDHRSLEGVHSIQQPLIAPLLNGRNAIELLGMIVGEGNWRAYHAVRRTVASYFPNPATTERAWQLALAQGVLAGAPTAAAPAAALAASLGSLATEAPSMNGWEVSFVACNKLLGGEWGNNAWLLELPDPISKVCWDNAALMSYASAQELGVRNGDLVQIARQGAQGLEVPATIIPGMADHCVWIALGWGRTKGGRNTAGAGFNGYAARTSDSYGFGVGYSVTKTGGRYPLALTQEHHSMENRPLAVDATLDEYKATPNFAQWEIPTPEAPPLWEEVDYTTPEKPAQGGLSWHFVPENRPAAPDAPVRYAWGMSIDLTTCTGCNACVVACFAENNIPMVGKLQIARGREMHWMRIDRYFTEKATAPWESRDRIYEMAEDELHVSFQPVACQHCEEAPCENVCPVNATAHSPEGLNDMAYNRCIGTRYCANNCPYKVRRFNYLGYNANVTELEAMQKNPNVSVRMRGVMEKCTFCVQRIQAARISARNAGARIQSVTPACAQACPSRAIAFGDLNDASQDVTRLSNADRHYKLLADIGTQPRTTFLGKIRNPRPSHEQEEQG